MPSALVWGASGGIGSACVKVLASNDWKVWGAARSEVTIPDGAMSAMEFDIVYPDSIQRAVMQVAQETTELDMTIYAVGTLAYDRLMNVTESSWIETLNSNLSGALYTTQQSLNLLRKGGYMVFIGAYIDHLRIPRMGAYSVAKAALDEMVIMLRKENRKHNFTVVRPGAVNTPFWNQVGFKMPEDAKRPDMVAEAILRHYQSGDNADLNL